MLSHLAALIRRPVCASGHGTLVMSEFTTHTLHRTFSFQTRFHHLSINLEHCVPTQIKLLHTHPSQFTKYYDRKLMGKRGKERKYVRARQTPQIKTSKDPSTPTHLCIFDYFLLSRYTSFILFNKNRMDVMTIQMCLFLISIKQIDRNILGSAALCLILW